MPPAPTSALLVLAGCLFGIGALGFLIRRNLIVMFMSVEVMLNAANLVLLAAARDRGWQVEGQILVIFVIAVAAAEAAVGLGLITALHRLKKSVSADSATDLKG
ncbi:MAG TPA: NADH-quinone oxidoreductase subunit NuoK [Planctomycetes bacterium]|nr:NADH-quinone oxidoreductase subunit NuoK [Planctomycetota bacterium]